MSDCPSVRPSHASCNYAKVPVLIKATISTNENASYAVYPALLTFSPSISIFRTPTISIPHVFLDRPGISDAAKRRHPQLFGDSSSRHIWNNRRRSHSLWRIRRTTGGIPFSRRLHTRRYWLYDRCDHIGLFGIVRIEGSE